MEWLYYLLEANLYLAIFYGFYRLFLHQETFYTLNRAYLVLSSVLAFALPFLQLGFLKKEMVFTYTGFVEVQEQTPFLTTENLSLLLYLAVSLVFVAKITWGLRHIKRLINGARKRKENGITIIEIENSKMAFSFFDLLFIDPNISQKATVLKHEMVHIKQLHSFDVLFFELIQISSWFNPITYLIKNDIKLIHEYLADEETTQKDIEKYEYALFLIQNSYGNQEVTLSNQFFNSSILKNRISMLNQKKSAKLARLKLLFVLPLTGSMLCLSTVAFTKTYSTMQLGAKKESLSMVLQDTLKKKSDKKRLPPPPPVEPNPAKTKRAMPLKDQVRFPPPIVKKDGKKLPPPVVKMDKKALPAPPPVEPKPTKNASDGAAVPKGPIPVENIRAKHNETNNVDVTAPTDKEEIKVVTVKGYPTSTNKKSSEVKSTDITPVKEVVITGYPIKKQLLLRYIHHVFRFEEIFFKIS